MHWACNNAHFSSYLTRPKLDVICTFCNTSSYSRTRYRLSPHKEIWARWNITIQGKQSSNSGSASSANHIAVNVVGTANLLVGMTKNVKVNIATCNSCFKYVHLGAHWFKFCNNTPSIAMDPALSALDVFGLSLDCQRYFGLLCVCPICGWISMVIPYMYTYSVSVCGLCLDGQKYLSMLHVRPLYRSRIVVSLYNLIPSTIPQRCLK